MGAAASTSYVTDPQTLVEHQFDYIIVGSGMLHLRSYRCWRRRR